MVAAWEDMVDAHVFRVVAWKTLLGEGGIPLDKGGIPLGDGSFKSVHLSFCLMRPLTLLCFPGFGDVLLGAFVIPMGFELFKTKTGMHNPVLGPAQEGDIGGGRGAIRCMCVCVCVCICGGENECMSAVL